ncbi:MAG: TatD family hydrolase [Fibrobacter sp.]|nr:TatD family hydrolase [Fibrobacter sp.]
MQDAHLHLTRLPHASEIAGYLKSVTGYSMVSSACTREEWSALEKLLEINSENLFPAFGIHPEAAARDQNFEAELRRLLEKYPEARVGECGLDKRYPGYEAGGLQEKILKPQIRLAAEYKRPLVIHIVGDYRRIFEILSECGFPSPEVPVIFHRFGGDAEILTRIQEIQGMVSVHRSSLQKESTRNALKKAGKISVCYETDADENFIATHFDRIPTAPEILKKLQETLKETEKEFARL